MQNSKKILVFLPVFIVSAVFLFMHYSHQYMNATPKRLLALNAAILLFYAWAIIGIVRRKQQQFQDMLVQSSFYVYVFSVLTLTGYFIIFNQISGHDWWAKTVARYHRRDGVNLEAFHFLKFRHIFTYEVVGNFIMLLPLGIYLPLLYKYCRNFFAVTLVAMLASVSIELMQLATGVRIADIDDVILNTSGASLGFIFYLIGSQLTTRSNKPMIPFLA